MTPADTASVVEDSPLKTGEVFADLLEESMGPDAGFCICKYRQVDGRITQS